MGKIVHLKELAESSKEKLREKVLEASAVIGRKPKLIIISIDADEASNIYMKNKVRACNQIGIEVAHLQFVNPKSSWSVIQDINKLNNSGDVDGIIVQLPIPEHLNQETILGSIYPSNDVDGFSSKTMCQIYASNRDNIDDIDNIPATALGILNSLETCGVTDVTGKNVVVVGRSLIVGKPIAHLLMAKGATVTICHSQTQDLASHTKNADIVIAAVGIPKMITKEMIKDGAVLVDVGINRVDGKVCGDIDTEDVLEKCSCVTAVPGGIGLMTVASLCYNVVKSYLKKYNESM